MEKINSGIAFPHAHAHRGHIPSVPDEAGLRPIWSVMIPTYNCANYLRVTLTSVLAQDPGPEQMQIEVVDDCSTKDDPAAVVREIGRNRVAFYRQPRNVGHTRNFETCLQRARGQLIHQLHGDDYVRDGFYAKMEAAFRNNPDIGAAFCRTIFANQAGHWIKFSGIMRNESGVLENFAEAQATRQYIQTPSMVVRRSVYERLGGFDRRLSWTEDLEMWARIAVHYPIWFETEPLAVYRIHENSSTYRKILVGENVQDIARCLTITSEYFPPEIGTRVRAMGSRYYAQYFISTYSCELLINGYTKAALWQIVEALKLSCDRRVLLEITSFFWLWLRTVRLRVRRRLSGT